VGNDSVDNAGVQGAREQSYKRKRRKEGAFHRPGTRGRCTTSALKARFAIFVSLGAMPNGQMLTPKLRFSAHLAVGRKPFSPFEPSRTPLRFAEKSHEGLGRQYGTFPSDNASGCSSLGPPTSPARTVWARAVKRHQC
jgi:hypothetical protein